MIFLFFIFFGGWKKMIQIEGITSKRNKGERVAAGEVLIAAAFLTKFLCCC